MTSPTATHIVDLDTPVGASLCRSAQGVFVRLHTQTVAPGGVILESRNIDILYEDLDDFILTLQQARHSIEARSTLESEAA